MKRWLAIGLAVLISCSRQPSPEPSAEKPEPVPTDPLAQAEVLAEPSSDPVETAPSDERQPAPEEPPPPPPPMKLAEAPTVKAITEAGGRLTQMGPNVWLGVTEDRRVVLVLSQVVLRRGYLEHLLCLTGTKEHEAILAAEIEPEVLHAALLAAGAEAGHPVRYDPEFEPPEGTELQIRLEWWDGKRFHTAPAREWIVHEETGKPMEFPWVFAGSQFVKNPITGEEYYLARSGDIITVVNMASAMIDVAGRSSDKNQELMFVAAEEKIPPVGTQVLIVLEPKRSEQTKPGN